MHAFVTRPAKQLGIYMHKHQRRYVVILFSFFLAGCVTAPVGPHVAVMPAKGKTLEQFKADDQTCKAYAQAQIGDDLEKDSAMNTLMDMAIGGAAGALGGQAIGHNTKGTVAGAGIGMAAGLATGAYQANKASDDAQIRYDNAYQECMHAKGHGQ